jgi:hypothetical protein
MVSTILHIRLAVFGGVAGQVGFYVLNAVVSVLLAHGIERLGLLVKERWHARRRRGDEKDGPPRRRPPR